MEKVLKQKNGITLIALVITIIVLLILAGISISMLSGDNSILQKVTQSKEKTERAEAKEQAQIDIMAWITDKTSKKEDSTLDDSKVKDILTGKSYVKTANATSFITAKGEYEIPYSELYNSSNNVTPSYPETPGNSLATLKATIENESEDCMIDKEGYIIPINAWRYEITGEDTCSIKGYLYIDDDEYDAVHCAYNGTVLQDGTLEYKVPVYIKVENKLYQVTELGYGSLFDVKTKNVEIPECITNIGAYALSNTNIESITIPNGVTNIGSYAFSSTKLESVNIPEGVTSIGERAFSWCSSLATLNLPNTLEFIGRDAFNSCSVLTEVIIPNNITSIGPFAFNSCTSLRTITIDSPYVASNYNKIGLSSESGLTLYIKDNITTINQRITIVFTQTTSDKSGYIKYVHND